MILLIDGYNLIKQVIKSTDVSPDIRSKFINELAGYSKKKNHKIVIVFDGGDFPFPSLEEYNNIQIIYSGYKDSADTVIKDYLSENSSKDILLVSSDRELRDCASKLNIDSIKSLEFYGFVNNLKTGIIPKKVRGDTVVHKTSSESDINLDELMMGASGRIYFKEEDFEVKNLIDDRKLENNSKKILKKIKKL